MKTVWGYLRNHHVGLLALFVALSGSAYAASQADQGAPGSDAVRAESLTDRSAGPLERKRQPKWRRVKRHPSTALPHAEACPRRIGVFCGHANSSADAFWWKNYGGEFARAAFIKDKLGFVHLRGLVRLEYLGGLPTSIFILPRGFRPERTLLFTGARNATGVNGSSTRIDVRRDGTVAWIWAGSGLEQVPPDYLSLDQISFRAR